MDRFAFFDFVIGEILGSNDPAALLNSLGDFLGQVTVIKSVGIARNAFQSARQFWLLENLSLLIRVPIALEDSARLGKLRESLALKLTRILPWQRKSIFCETNCGSHYFGESQFAPLLLCFRHSGY